MGTIGRHCAVGYISLAIDTENLLLIHVFDQVTHAIHDDLMGHHHQHPSAGVLTRDRLEQSPQAKNLVTPAFASQGSKIKLSRMNSLLVEIRILLLDAKLGQAIENAEFLFAQTLVEAKRHLVQPFQFGRKAGRFLGAQVRKARHEFALCGTGSLLNQPPRVSDWASPSVDSGTSISRQARSMTASPADSAASRATFPALCPCRTIHNVSGQSECITASSG